MHIFTTNLVNSLRNHQTVIIKKVLPLLLFSILFAGKGFANVYVPTTFTDPAFTGIGLISLRSALKAAEFIDEGANTSQVPLNSCGAFPLLPALEDNDGAFELKKEKIPVVNSINNSQNVIPIKREGDKWVSINLKDSKK